MRSPLDEDPGPKFVFPVRLFRVSIPRTPQLKATDARPRIPPSESTIINPATPDWIPRRAAGFVLRGSVVDQVGDCTGIFVHYWSAPGFIVVSDRRSLRAGLRYARSSARAALLSIALGDVAWTNGFVVVDAHGTGVHPKYSLTRAGPGDAPVSFLQSLRQDRVVGRLYGLLEPDLLRLMLEEGPRPPSVAGRRPLRKWARRPPNDATGRSGRKFVQPGRPDSAGGRREPKEDFSRSMYYDVSRYTHPGAAGALPGRHHGRKWPSKLAGEAPFSDVRPDIQPGLLGPAGSGAGRPDWGPEAPATPAGRVIGPFWVAGRAGL